MPRLINTDNLAEYKFASDKIIPTEWQQGWNDALDTVMNEVPTVDAEPVRHGHWNENNDGTLWCSVCISEAPCEEDYWGYVRNAPHYDYCPNCGARMDEERREDGGVER